MMVNCIAGILILVKFESINLAENAGRVLRKK